MAGVAAPTAGGAAGDRGPAPRARPQAAVAVVKRVTRLNHPIPLPPPNWPYRIRRISAANRLSISWTVCATPAVIDARARRPNPMIVPEGSNQLDTTWKPSLRPAPVLLRCVFVFVFVHFYLFWVRFIIYNIFMFTFCFIWFYWGKGRIGNF